ncbi:hypothetical protein [Niabella beijingensis]|uniref:hypothetical protein n=1 Tax=Niabella beijingensis TaxID=2872700 RepID=UPI001CC051F8|nr:hypothetical protein [Niabella beijingensis]MBZ4191929.1 hypothetical protein [Niabella beijingensis]
MKKILTTILTLTILNVSNAQTGPITDTSAYLKTIESKKAYFKGKPLSVLLDSLKIPIKTFGSKPKPTDVSKEIATYFYFAVPKYLEDFSEKYLRIEWTTPLDANASELIFNATAIAGEWTIAAQNFYKTAIISDIRAK